MHIEAEFQALPTARSLFTVSIPDVGGAPPEIGEFSSEKVELIYPLATAPILPIGQSMPLVFEATGLPSPVVVTAGVQTRVETDGQRLYGFEFSTWRELWKHLTPELREHFNRRHAYRVRPGRGQSIGVLVQSDDADIEIHAEVQDISSRGLRFSREGVEEDGLANVQSVRVSFQLPTFPDVLSLGGEIRHRRLRGPTTHYGVEFDLERTPHFERLTLAILDYVFQRQREKWGL